jgi:hypothetical protein
MTKISLQFHADSAELMSDLLPRWFEGLELELAWEEFRPDYRATTISIADLATLEVERVSRLSASVHPIDTGASTSLEFLARNPGVLTVTPGRLTSDGLREAALGAVAEDEESVARWRTVQRRARSSLRRGAHVVNPVSGAREAVPSHLYSAGAAALAARGVPILAAAGWNQYQLGSEITQA